jgi:hypothetical protein
MEITILDSILHGDLKPWMINTASPADYSKILKPTVVKQAATLSVIKQQIAALLADYPALQQPYTTAVTGADAPLHPLLFDAALPDFSNAQTQYYYTLTTKETLHISNNITLQAEKLTNDIDRRYIAKQTLKDIRILAAQTTDELRERNYDTTAVAPADFIHFVLLLLKQALTALYFDIQERFAAFLTEIETEENFIIHTLKEDYTGTARLTPSVNYYSFKAEQLLQQQQFDKAAALQLLIALQQHIGTESQLVQAALENYIFLNTQPEQTEAYSIEGLTEKDNVKQQVENCKKIINQQLNQLAFGYQRLEIVNTALDELDYLSDSKTNLLSIPQKIYNILTKQREIYTAKFLEKFPVETDAGNANSDTVQAPAKLTFGFHGTKAKLKNVITELTNKIELLNEEKTAIDELVNLLCSKDIQINAVQIHLNCETVQFRYIIDKLSNYFHGLTPVNIAASQAFYSKKAKLITAQNLYSSKVENAKEQATIDNIINQLQ